MISRFFLSSLRLFLLALLLPAWRNAPAEPWFYDFGSGTGSWTSGSSITFVPDPEPNGGNDYVSIGSGGGSWNLDNPGDPGLGSESELRGVAPTGTSVNKFSIRDWSATYKTFYMKATVKLSGGVASSYGTWYWFVGNGTTFSDGNPVTSSHVFSGVRWAFGAGGAITTNYRSGANWVAGPTGLSSSFAKDTLYTVEVYGNNTTGSASYHRSGSEYTVASNKWDLWVAGTRYAGLNKGEIANNITVDSLMFYGESSTANSATITLDDLEYGTALPVAPPTPTDTPTWTPTDTPSPTATPTQTPTHTPTDIPTDTPSATSTSTPTREAVAGASLEVSDAEPLALYADGATGLYACGIDSAQVSYTGPQPTPPVLTFAIDEPTPIAIEDLGGGQYQCVWTTGTDPGRIRNVFQVTVSGAESSEVGFVPYAVLSAIVRDDSGDLQNATAVGLGGAVESYAVFRFDPTTGGVFALPQVGGPVPAGNDPVDGTPLWRVQATIVQLQSIYGAAQHYVATGDWIAY